MDDRAAVEAVVRRYVEEGPLAELSEGPLQRRDRVRSLVAADIAEARTEIQELEVERIDGADAVVRLTAVHEHRHVAGAEHRTVLSGPVVLRRDAARAWKILDLQHDGRSLLGAQYGLPDEQTAGAVRVAATCELHGDHVDVFAVCENTGPAPARVRFASAGTSMGPLWLEYPQSFDWSEVDPGDHHALGARLQPAPRTAFAVEVVDEDRPPVVLRFTFEPPRDLPPAFLRAIRSAWGKQAALTVAVALAWIWGAGLEGGLGATLVYGGLLVAVFLWRTRGSGAALLAAAAAPSILVGVALVALAGSGFAWSLAGFGVLLAFSPWLVGRLKRLRSS